jgi:hypothetical protein
MYRRRREWSVTEEKILIENYHKFTIKELETLFPERKRESINNKIKRLKQEGKIKEGKPEDVIERAYKQRGEERPFMTIDQLLNR